MDFSNIKLEILDYMNRLNVRILDLDIKQNDDKLFVGFKTLILILNESRIFYFIRVVAWNYRIYNAQFR